MNYYDFLNEHLSPAFGCTEPAAIAYACAKCGFVLEEEPCSIEIIASPNVVKNAKSVKMPGLYGRVGIKYAAAAGALFGDYGKKLSVLSSVKQEDTEKLDEFVKSDRVKVFQKENFPGVYVEAIIHSENGFAKVVIENEHDNIVYIEKNGEVVFEKKREGVTQREKMDFSFEKIRDFAKNCDTDRLKYVLEREIETNYKIAQEGLKGDRELNIGKILLEKDSPDLSDLIIAYTSAAADARMSGCKLPVIINAGSGDQGITVSVPVIVFAKEKNLSRETLYRGLVFGNLLGFYQKEGIGKLSAYCGTVTAASAAVCAISFMNGDDKKTVEGVLNNSLATLSGMICDGAKAGCAVKICMSVTSALNNYKLSKKGKFLKTGDGIVGKNADETIESVGIIAREGMKKTDSVIIDQMLKN